jgi:hypothetical protein
MWKKGLVTLLVVAGLGTLVVRSLLGLQRWRCDVCMTFNGETRCQKASGKTRDEALRTAVDTACAPITAGMGESMACANTPPSKVVCAER